MELHLILSPSRALYLDWFLASMVPLATTVNSYHHMFLTELLTGLFFRYLKPIGLELNCSWNYHPSTHLDINPFLPIHDWMPDSQTTHNMFMLVASDADVPQCLIRHCLASIC